MYNKCSKCGKLLDTGIERKLVLDEKGNIQTKCMKCYESGKELEKSRKYARKF